MASLQSVRARSESFFAHHHPQRLLKALARSCVDTFESLTMRSQAEIPASALVSSPTNLQRSRSALSAAKAGPDSIKNVANAGARTKNRIFPPNIFARGRCLIVCDYLRWQAAILQVC